jgi:hypothetical protein
VDAGWNRTSMFAVSSWGKENVGIYVSQKSKLGHKTERSHINNIMIYIKVLEKQKQRPNQ